ncbi:MAG TPA: RecX family transcriptional regulator [Tepidisphaeraceae bacterium]|nr:RecX family transcriptional regulator [Tepidisphaeraceae bacterium]
MPIVTKLSEQKRRPNRRNVFLDGAFAFGVNLNVVAKFHLREGQALTEDEVLEIQRGEVRQECLDKAFEYLGTRLHSRAELRRKLMKREYGDAVVDGVLDDCQRLGYLDDERFAKSRALSAAQHKHHGQRRAVLELRRAGVKADVAERAAADVYDATDPVAEARRLAERQAPRLRKLDPLVAKRRLVGMLQRRGFNYEAIKPVVDAVLGTDGARDAGDN